MGINMRPVVSVRIGDPAIAGRIGVDGFHWGHNWEADYDATDPLSAPWEHDNTEYMKSMHAIAPQEYVAWTDMDLANWTYTNGTWRTEPPATGMPRVDYLHYLHVAGGFGCIVSNYTFRPGVMLRMLRYVPPDGETRTPYILIEMLGSPGGYGYGLAVPGGDVSLNKYRNPRLYKWEYGQPLDEDAPFAEMPGDVEPTPVGAMAEAQDIGIEQLDDYLRIRISGIKDEWVYCTEGQPLGRGYMRITSVGHAVMLNAQATKFPGSSSAKPQRHIVVPAWMGNADPAYHPSGHRPAYTNIDIEEDADIGGRTRPTVTFAVSGADTRPLVYRIHQANTASITAEAETFTNITVEDASWNRTDEWRGADFTCNLKDFGASPTLFPPNSLAQFGVAWDTGGTPPTPTVRITGYLDDTEITHTGSQFQGARIPRLVGRDGPSTQLANKKFMREMPSFEDWLAGDAFEFILNSCGVASSWITVAAGVADMAIPYANPHWERVGEFSESDDVIRALDTIFQDTLGLQWGWGPNGYFLRQHPEYGGTPDWILDWDNADGQDIVESVKICAGWNELRNYVMAVNATGEYQVAHDADSHRTASAANYIGSDWWDIVQADADDTLAYLAMRRLAELRRFSLFVELTCEHLELGPDDYIRIDNCPSPELPDGTVFKIIEESGRIRGLDCSLTFLCGVEQYGAS